MDLEAQKALKGEIPQALFLYSSLRIHFWPLPETVVGYTDLQSDPPRSLFCHLQEY